MGKETLSKLQMGHYKELKSAFTESGSEIIGIPDEEFVRLKDVISLLMALGYIQSVDIDGMNALRKIGNFDDFEAWHKDREQEERKLSVREWKIAIVSAIVGAIIGQIPTIISFFSRIMQNGGS